MLIKTIVLDIDKNIYEKIEAKEGDIGSRTLKFCIKNKGLPYNLANKKVKFYANKPDGTFIYNNMNIIEELEGLCEVKLTSQALAVSGTLKAELVITEEDKKLTSMVFDIEVLKCINNDAAVESIDEFTVLDELINRAHQYDRKLEDIFANLNNWTEEEKQKYLNWIENNKYEFENITSELLSWSDEKKQEFILAIETWKNNRDSEFLKWQDEKRQEFLEWFQNIKDILSEEVATKLIVDVEELKEKDVIVKEELLRLEDAKREILSKVTSLEDSKSIVDEKLLELDDLINNVIDGPVYIEDITTKSKYIWSMENGAVYLNKVVE